MSPTIHIDRALLERYLTELARFGAEGATGVRRPVYSPEWRAAADQYAAWCREAGLAVREDAVGNVWGRLEGRVGGRAVVSGSHIDTQLPGGRYDGALGAVGALVAVRALREQFGQPRRPLEVVAFCEEEGSRFPAANFWSSRAVMGLVAPGEAEAMRDWEGVTLAEAMRSVGLDPAKIPEAERDDLDVFVELHIEQGPVLEHAGLAAGVVTAITGLRHYHVTVRGEANHAGAFPMDLRRDPMAGAAEIISGVLETARALGRPAVTTVGRVLVEPNYPAIIPESVAFTVDARHPEPAALADLFARHEALFRRVDALADLEVRWHTTLDRPPVPCDGAIVRALQAAAEAAGTPSTLLHSGAGHDGLVMSRRCKVAMIFVRSAGGRSHTPEEFSSIEDCAAGVEILARGLYELAY